MFSAIVFKMYLKTFMFWIVIIITTSNFCESGNILVILPTPVRSHFNVMNSIVSVLAAEHNITFYSAYKFNNSHPNITEHYIESILNKLENRVTFFSDIISKDQSNQLIYLLDGFIQHYDGLLKQNALQQLLNTTEKFDLFLNLAMLGEHLFKIANKLDVPIIQVTLSVPLLWTNIQSNNHINLGFDLNLITSQESFDFTSRLTNLIKQVYVWLYYEWIYLPKIEKITKKYFPPDIPTAKEVAQIKTEGLLVNYLSPMGYARPFAQNVLEIGGLHCKPPQKLPLDLEKYISDSGEHGIIYFSLGSTVSDLNLSPTIKTSILNVFKKLPQRILWKLDENIENLPENVMIRKWFPQQDILGHNKTRLFITQGGMSSMQEAAYHGVQVLVLPMFMDQFTNGQVAQLMGYGKVIKFNEFDEILYLKYILDLINNFKYKQNIKFISEAIKDQLASRRNELKQWTNFIIKHRNSSLKPLTGHFSYIELLELDIYFTIFLIIITFFIIFIYMLCKLYRFVAKHIYTRYVKIKKE